METPDLVTVGLMLIAVLVGTGFGQRQAFDGRVRRRVLVVSSLALTRAMRRNR